MYLKTFLKGIMMGICDIIPGISGGTVAFITGIYERLIDAVKGFSPVIIKHINKPKLLRKDIKVLDLKFLITLFSGIALAILIGSKIIKYLLGNHFSYTMSFFIGLILSSSLIIYKKIENKNSYGFGILGLLAGLSLAYLIPLNITPTYPYIFFCGFIAISAMFLPGISGAYILVILGVYEFMINAIHNLSIDWILIFIIGAALGAFFISRLVHFMFEKSKSSTLFFLLGLVLGALAIPIKKIASFNAISFLLLIAGFLIVNILLRFER